MVNEILWVDRSHQRKCSAHDSQLLLALLLSYCPLFIFILEFCPEHISKTILAMVMKFFGWLQIGVIRRLLRQSAVLVMFCLVLIAHI